MDKNIGDEGSERGMGLIRGVARQARGWWRSAVIGSMCLVAACSSVVINSPFTVTADASAAGGYTIADAYTGVSWPLGDVEESMGAYSGQYQSLTGNDLAVFEVTGGITKVMQDYVAQGATPTEALTEMMTGSTTGAVISGGGVVPYQIIAEILSAPIMECSAAQ